MTTLLRFFASKEDMNVPGLRYVADRVIDQARPTCGPRVYQA
ncbi:hypothetical protein OH764_36325 (plasmid) [Burkholderia sp. M6-3]